MQKINLIAEIGINHNGDLFLAKKLIDCAYVAGFDYVKFQKRNPEICVPESQKNILRSTPWGDMTYIQYKHRIEFGLSEYEELFKYSENRGIKCFASVWDLTSAQFMKRLTNIVKIPSAKITDYELLSYCQSNFSTIMISTGMSTQEEIDLAVKFLPDVIFHTNSTYPCPYEDLNLNYIEYLKNKYEHKYEVGYSGHEIGLTTTYAVAAMGVKWIERHITLDHDMWGTDQKSSVDPVGMIKLVRGIRDIEKALGSGIDRVPTEAEKKKAKELR